MTARASRCPRAWEAEAARDGRLVGEAAKSFGIHAAQCADCRRENALLEELPRRLAALAPPPDEVSLRRLRGRVQRDADVELRGGRDSAARPRAWLVALAGMIAVGAGVWTAVHLSGHEHERVVVVAATGAVWSRTSTPTEERIDLRDGVLRLTIQRSAHDPPLHLRVPDGEIEDLGTSFIVSVTDAHTAEIAVSEGAVLFRRESLANVMVAAGQHWARESDRPMQGAVPPSESERHGGPVRLADDLGAAGASAAAHLPETPATRAAAAPSTKAAELHHDDATTLKHTAKANAGDEDQAYLRIVTLLRSGDRAAARAAAQEYLARFPTGFRRAEVTRVAQDASVTP